MTKSEVMDWIGKDRLVPVVRAASADAATITVEALLEGGISILEVTMTVPNAAQVIQQISSRYGDRVLVGAGTVLDADTARLCVNAGAQFIVSPGLDLGTVAACNALGVLVAPGALTPTEILTAWRAGADVVKVFPCDAMGGPTYLKSLLAPMPNIPLMPTGGVTLDNLSDYIRAGATAVGVGGSLVDPTISYSSLVERATAFVVRAKADGSDRDSLT